MKALFLVLCISTGNALFAQNSSVEMKGDFAELSKLGRIQGAESLPTYSSNNVKGTRYLFDNWIAGSVTTIKNEVISNIYLFMFDKQNNDLYIKQRDSSVILLADKKEVKKFTLNNKHTFIQGAQIAGGETDKFYEILAGREDRYVFYKLIKTKFLKANKQDAERIKNGDFDDEYKDEITYFIQVGNQPLQKVKLNENNITKALPAENKKIKNYFDTHSSDDIDEQFVRHLVDELNDQAVITNSFQK